MAHGIDVDFEEPRLAPPKELEGLTPEQQKVHDAGLEEAKQRVLERVRKQNGNNGQ